MAIGLNKEQLDLLKGMEGINQNLVSAYEKNGQNLTKAEQDAIKNANTSPDRLGEIASSSFVSSNNKKALGVSAAAATGSAPTPSKPQDRVSGYTRLSAALQEAVNLGRQQRQSAELDFLKGAIPEGAVTAGKFTGLLRNLNQASTNFTEPLVDSVLAESARINEDIRANQDAIRDLTLTMIDNGASQESINSILSFSETGDIDSALRVAASAINVGGSGKRKVEKVGSNLVSYDPADPDNTTQVMFAAPSGSGGGGSTGGNTGFFNSGSIRIPDSDLGELSIELNDSRGDDGFANTDLYVQAYRKWVQNGGLPQDFFKQFDPDNYLNPSDPTIPPDIRNSMKKLEGTSTSNPFR